MAIDGVKIIDSDDGYDIYNSIVERYKDGENIDNIIADILEEESNYYIDDFTRKFVGLHSLTRFGKYKK